MNKGTLLVLGLLLLVIGSIVGSMMKKKKKKGGSTCGCGCSSCAMSGSCHKKNKPSDLNKNLQEKESLW